MKLTTRTIRQIILEEISKIIHESVRIEHREKAFIVNHNGVDVKVIPLDPVDFEYYKNKGFFKHFANIKDFHTQLGKPTNVEDFKAENLTGYYEVIENSGLHNAAIMIQNANVLKTIKRVYHKALTKEIEHLQTKAQISASDKNTQDLIDYNQAKERLKKRAIERLKSMKQRIKKKRYLVMLDGEVETNKDIFLKLWRYELKLTSSLVEHTYV